MMRLSYAELANRYNFLYRDVRFIPPNSSDRMTSYSDDVLAVNVRLYKPAPKSSEIR